MGNKEGKQRTVKKKGEGKKGREQRKVKKGGGKKGNTKGY